MTIYHIYRETYLYTVFSLTVGVPVTRSLPFPGRSERLGEVPDGGSEETVGGGQCPALHRCGEAKHSGSHATVTDHQRQWYVRKELRWQAYWAYIEEHFELTSHGYGNYESF